MTNERQWSVWAISDADEPGDAVVTGMRHRNYDDVMLVLITDEDGWLEGEAAELPARPLLLFYCGAEPTLDDALTWLARHEEEALCAVAVPSPTTFEDCGGQEATHTVAVNLNYPPYPWLEEARLGMEMGRYFDSVELTDWTEPTGNMAGSHTFRFFRSDETPSKPLSTEVPDDSWPF